MTEPRERLAVAHNRQAWNAMAEGQHVLAKPAKAEELRDPLKVVDSLGWLSGGIEGWNVLCLAAGGGRHGPLYTAAGASVTVVDISSAMLELDRRVAEENKMRIRTFESSMDDLSMLKDGEFDLVIHPVSTCYLPSLDRLFPEVARVCRSGGLYISQHKQPINLQASLSTYTGHYVVEHPYYDPGPVPPATEPSKLREPNTHEFAHSWNALLGGMCRSGFVIEDVAEPLHARENAPVGTFHHRCHYLAPYIRLKARRIGNKPALVL